VVVWSLTRGPLTAAATPIAGSLLYLVGVVGITRAFHIPRNDALASAAPDSAASAAFWAEYLASWTAWNHVRTAAAVVAALSFGVALAKQARLV